MSGNLDQTYSIVPPPNGLWRLTMREIGPYSSAASESRLLTGGETSMRLLPGRYLAQLENVGGFRDPVYFSVQLDKKDRVISLPDVVSGNEPSHDPRLQPSMIRPSVREMYRSAWQDDLRELSLLEARVPGTRGEASQVKEVSVAVSENVRVGAGRGGWEPLERVSASAESGSYGALSVVFREIEPEDRNRVRVSVGIEGSAALRIPIPLFTSGLKLRLAKLKNTKDLRPIIEPSDVQINALVAALHSLSDIEAVSVLRWSDGLQLSDAVRMLEVKRQDYWAATAAALLLVKIRALDVETAQWVLNLVRLAPHIPDASIAAAWSSAIVHRDNDDVENIVLGYLRKGLRTGGTTYAISQALAIDLLSSLRTSAKDAEVRKLADADVKIWLRRKSISMVSGAFSFWEQSGPNLRSGDFPLERYTVLAKGQLSGDGFNWMSAAKVERKPA